MKNIQESCMGYCALVASSQLLHLVGFWRAPPEVSTGRPKTFFTRWVCARPPVPMLGMSCTYPAWRASSYPGTAGETYTCTIRVVAECPFTWENAGEPLIIRREVPRPIRLACPRTRRVRPCLTWL